MPNINAKANFNFGFLPVDINFITQYMPEANGTYVKVYLFVLYNSYYTSNELNTQHIAASLDLLESDVMQALQYWMKKNLLKLSSDDSGLHIEFITPSDRLEDVEEIYNEVKTKQVDSSQKLNLEKRPEYTPEEISVYSSAKEIKQMFLVAQQYLGKALTPTDLNILYSFYDWLRLPTDVIELLLEYCIANNHRSLRYIEKVALSWADQGINTIDKAKQQIYVFNKKYRSIMKAFGISRREPAPKEIEFMKKWIDTYSFDIDIIEEACNRTISNISQPNFQYTDSILTSWYNHKVKNFDDIRSLDSTFAKNKTKESTIKDKKVINNKNSNNVSAKSFINFKQRDDWDFDELKRLEREHLERKLLEGR